MSPSLNSFLLTATSLLGIALTPFSFICAGILALFLFVHFLESTNSSVTGVSEAADLLNFMPSPSTTQNYSEFQDEKYIANFSSQSLLKSCWYLLLLPQLKKVFEILSWQGTNYYLCLSSHWPEKLYVSIAFKTQSHCSTVALESLKTIYSVRHLQQH